jgi:hypothetical protein
MGVGCLSSSSIVGCSLIIARMQKLDRTCQVLCADPALTADEFQLSFCMGLPPPHKTLAVNSC